MPFDHAASPAWKLFQFVDGNAGNGPLDPQHIALPGQAMLHIPAGTSAAGPNNHADGLSHGSSALLPIGNMTSDAMSDHFHFADLSAGNGIPQGPADLSSGIRPPADRPSGDHRCRGPGQSCRPGGADRSRDVYERGPDAIASLPGSHPFPRGHRVDCTSTESCRDTFYNRVVTRNKIAGQIVATPPHPALRADLFPRAGRGNRAAFLLTHSSAR